MDGLTLRLTDGEMLGDSDALSLELGEALADGETDGLMDGLTLGDILGDSEAEGDTLGLSDGDGMVSVTSI